MLDFQIILMLFVVYRTKMIVKTDNGTKHKYSLCFIPFFIVLQAISGLHEKIFTETIEQLLRAKNTQSAAYEKI